jgi:hypothetical protein
MEACASSRIDLVAFKVGSTGPAGPERRRRMGNHQQNEQPRHEQKTREGQRLGDTHPGGKADEGETALDQDGKGKGREPRTPEGGRQ